ncbi:MAG: hypothetical protein CL878_13385, partial [Dehalococcoidia bacterium]|nr:hypothetical protein [Dehalococcoidia bacterium]
MPSGPPTEQSGRWSRLAARLRSLVRRGRRTGEALAYTSGLLWTHARLPSGGLLLLALLAGVTTPLLVVAMTGLLDTLGTRPADPWSAIAPWLLVMLGALLFRNIELAATSYLAMLIREQVEPVLRHQLAAHAIAVPLSSFEQPEYYQKLETGQQAAAGFDQLLLTGTLLVTGTIGLAGLLLLFARAHPLLAVVLLATVLGQTIVHARLSRRWAAVNYRASPLRRALSYWSTQLSSRDAAPELRLFGLAPTLLGRWQAVFDQFLTDMTAARWQRAWQSLATAVLQEAVGWLTILVLLLLALQGTVTLGSLVALLYGLTRFRAGLERLSQRTSFLVERWARVEQLRAFLALPVEPRPSSPGGAIPRQLRQGVQFQGVSFTYPGSDQPALANVTLTLRPADHLALVGENGSGKTTLVRLLLGLYRPDRGQITVDGMDLQDLDPAEWRRHATAIFQDFMQYPTSVGENIGYADIALLGDVTTTPQTVHPRIVTAATQSAATAFIPELPQGYATLLGKEFEDATELSAGQWQRLALARAYLREAQLIVLDEPTAALDPRAEVAVYRQFREVAAGRGAVFISHRLGSARLADRIIV